MSITVSRFGPGFVDGATERMVPRYDDGKKTLPCCDVEVNGRTVKFDGDMGEVTIPRLWISLDDLERAVRQYEHTAGRQVIRSSSGGPNGIKRIDCPGWRFFGRITGAVVDNDTGCVFRRPAGSKGPAHHWSFRRSDPDFLRVLREARELGAKVVHVKRGHWQAVMAFRSDLPPGWEERFRVATLSTDRLVVAVVGKGPDFARELATYIKSQEGCDQSTPKAKKPKRYPRTTVVAY